MSSNQLRHWVNLVENAIRPLTEFDVAGGDGAGNYYAATVSFMDEYRADRSDVNDADMESDMEWLRTVANGFAKGIQQGFSALIEIDSQLQDELLEWYQQNGLTPYKHFKSAQDSLRQQPTRRSTFDKKTSAQALAIMAPIIAKNLFSHKTNSAQYKKIEQWYIQNFASLMSSQAAAIVANIEKLLASNPSIFGGADEFADSGAGEILSRIYFQSALHKTMNEKAPDLEDDIALSIDGDAGSYLWNAYLVGAGYTTLDELNQLLSDS